MLGRRLPRRDGDDADVVRVRRRAQVKEFTEDRAHSGTRKASGGRTREHDREILSKCCEQTFELAWGRMCQNLQHSKGMQKSSPAGKLRAGLGAGQPTCIPSQHKRFRITQNQWKGGTKERCNESSVSAGHTEQFHGN
mmetsp:Transcript_7709/g.17606  ORF Transcript_7709/g.17606 Transcript_7709/m.17606 type:complete len:138 (+) Transcript_7709:24-437(+)